MNKKRGTIEWFNCNDILPEKLVDSNTSELVLVYSLDTKMANTDFYLHDRNQFFAYKNATHWAILNKP